MQERKKKQFNFRIGWSLIASVIPLINACALSRDSCTVHSEKIDFVKDKDINDVCSGVQSICTVFFFVHTTLQVYSYFFYHFFNFKTR